LLVVEQLLEIIFTLLTVNVPDELPAPLAEGLAAAPALPLTLPAALPEAEPLGLLEAPVEVLLLASDPLSRTWWPTWSFNFDMSPASCQVFPVLSVSV